MDTRSGSVTLPSAGPVTRLPVTVREELLLVDRRTGLSSDVTVPLVSSPATDLGALRDDLLRRRRAASASAAEHDALLVATGVAPWAEPKRDVEAPTASPESGGLVIRVEVPDRPAAVRVSRRLRLWLPLVGAVTANSPFESGSDTGHASWRFVQVHRYALGALVPDRHYVTDPAGDSADLEAAEAGLPKALHYWHVRPVGGKPAVEIRAGDAGLTADDSVVVAALLRTAVAAAVDVGRPEIAVMPDVLRSAQWRAARNGLTGSLIDPYSGQPEPARQVLDRCVTRMLPDGDGAAVQDGLLRLRREGTGAERQRQLVKLVGDVRSALPALARLTVQG